MGFEELNDIVFLLDVINRLFSSDSGKPHNYSPRAGRLDDLPPFLPLSLYLSLTPKKHSPGSERERERERESDD
jgi:hypothetical protein